MFSFRKRTHSIDPEDVFTDSLRGSGFDEYEGVMDVPVSRWSVYLVSLAVLAFSGVFLYKAYSFQVLDYDELSKKAFKNNFTSVPILAMRGSIVDSRGEVLAQTVKSTTTEDAYSRVYTERTGLGNVLGFVSYPQKDSSGNYWQESFKGVSGIEEYYNQLLAGSSGEKLFEKTADGKKQDGFIATQPINGKDIELSIDAQLQEYMYRELQNFLQKNNYKGGAGLIMNTETGEILTLVSYPTFDSNRLTPDYTKSSTTRAEYYKFLEADPLKPFINRPISGVYTPGSIVKPMLAIAALQKGVINPATSIYSSGKIEVPNPYTGEPTIFRDWRVNSWTNVREAIAVSSDVFFYSVIGGYEGQKGIGIVAVDEFAKAFGFNEETGIDLSGEKVGVIPTPDWKEEVFGEPWRLGDTYNSSIGQFGFTVTPIGIARVLSGIVSAGDLVQPKILKHTDLQPVVKEKVGTTVNPEWYKVVKEGMRLAVTDGTVTNLNMPYVQVAAKTGTAEIGNSKSKVHTWITGFFPYDNPKYIFVLIAESGKRGDSPNPSLVMNKVFDWMRIYRPEYLGFSPERIERERLERERATQNIPTTTEDIIATDTAATSSEIQIGEIPSN